MNTTQADTIARLDSLSTVDWTVDAGALNTEATEVCANDSAHGPGTCYTLDADGLCPDCVEDYLRTWVLEAGVFVSVDVLGTEGNV